MSLLHRRRRSAGAVVVGLILALAPAALAAQDGTTVELREHDEFGQILVASENQMTLYIFTVDEPNQSNCTDDCLAAWPPLTVDEGVTPSAGPGVEGTLGVIEREDTGEFQVTLDGQPLYFWVNDAAPGDTTGHGVNDVWFVIDQAVEVADDPADDEETPTPADTGSAGLIGGSGTPTGLILLGLAATVLLLGGARLATRR